MPVQSESFWVGYLSHTVAAATVEPDPKPILKAALKDFLAERPPGNELGDMLRATLKEKR